jgi:hypothetical protein
MTPYCRSFKSCQHSRPLHEGEGRIFSNYSSSVLPSHLSIYRVSGVSSEYLDPIGVVHGCVSIEARGDRRPRDHVGSVVLPEQERW